MLSALGTHFCRPEGLGGRSRGGCARVLAYGNPNLGPRARTCRGTRPGGLRVNKSGFPGLGTWYPPMLRVLNPFPALGSPNSKVLGGLGAENLKIRPKTGQNPVQDGLKSPEPH